jgi:hypothetical protein
LVDFHQSTKQQRVSSKQISEAPANPGQPVKPLFKQSGARADNIAHAQMDNKPIVL